MARINRSCSRSGVLGLGNEPDVSSPGAELRLAHVVEIVSRPGREIHGSWFWDLIYCRALICSTTRRESWTRKWNAAN